MKKRQDGLYQKSIRLPSGKRKVFYGKTKAELDRKILAYQYETELGRTFGEVADQWEEYHDSIVRYQTMRTSRAPLRRAVERFGAQRVKDVHPEDIVRYIRAVEATGLSKRTVQLYRDTLSQIFDYAIATGTEITMNPCAAVRLSPGLKQTTRELPSEEDVQKIIEHRFDDRFSFLPFLLLYTGLRVGEALALTRKDFTDVISVTKKVSWQPNQPVVDHFTKTERGIRSVPLLDIVRDSLPEWDGYLWGGEKPLTLTVYRRAWERYAKRTGVTCDRHTLRHWFVTQMYEAGLDAPDAAKITGHDVTVMQKTYLHITEQRQKASASLLNDFISKQGSKSVVTSRETVGNTTLSDA